jgi:ABC-2 type transport system ATP-binding protein
VHSYEVDGSVVRLDADDSDLGDAIRRLSDAGLRALRCTPPTLEELFLRHYGDQPGEPPEDAENEREPAP